MHSKTYHKWEWTQINGITDLRCIKCHYKFVDFYNTLSIDMRRKIDKYRSNDKKNILHSLYPCNEMRLRKLL